MDFRQWLINELRSPPHMPLPYFENKLQTIKTLEQRLIGFPAWLENEAAEFFYNFTGKSAYRYLRVPYEIVNKLPGKDESRYTFEAFSSRLARFLEYLKFDNTYGWFKYLKGVLPFGEKDTVRDVMMRDDDFQKIDTFLRESPQLIKDIQSDADFLKGGSRYDPSDNWPSLQEAIQYVQKAVQGFQDIRLLLRELHDLDTKTRALVSEQQWASGVDYGQTDRHKRDTKPIEVLYHATANVRQILQDGLKSRSELDGKGKLGGGVSDLVSFTSDLQIAVAIANALITAAKVVNGEITFQDIMDRAVKQGVDLTGSQPYRDLQMDQKRRESGWKPEGKFAYMHQDESYAFSLLRYYLGRAQEKNILYDPFFSNVDIKDLEGLDEKEIGVVACRVKMDNAKFEAGMQEFRVPSRDILRCKKLNVRLQSVL